MKYIFILVMLALISGCASLTSPARKHELDNNTHWIDYDATRRGAIVSIKDGVWKSCAEPTPDVAISALAKLEGKIKKKIDVKAELSQNIVNLAEKTQMVLFLRESLFRLCENSINKNLDANQVQSLYLEVMKTALALVNKEKSETEAEAKLVRLKSANEAQAIYKYLHQNNVDSKIIENLLKTLK